MDGRGNAGIHDLVCSIVVAPESVEDRDLFIEMFTLSNDMMGNINFIVRR
jgi:hypothetical protein